MKEWQRHCKEPLGTTIGTLGSKRNSGPTMQSGLKNENQKFNGPVKRSTSGTGSYFI